MIVGIIVFFLHEICVSTAMKKILVFNENIVMPDVYDFVHRRRYYEGLG